MRPSLLSHTLALLPALWMMSQIICAARLEPRYGASSTNFSFVSASIDTGKSAIGFTSSANAGISCITGGFLLLVFAGAVGAALATTGGGSSFSALGFSETKIRSVTAMNALIQRSRSSIVQSRVDFQ